jgi:hypothetical protein
MCCLTIYRNLDNEYIFTHNRDESLLRPLGNNQINGITIGQKTVYMPKDPVSNGTWIATNGEMTAAILNGYKVAHVKESNYKASRGIIIPYLFEKDSIALFSNQFDPAGFEPFTLLVYHKSEGLYEFGWDNSQLVKTKLDGQNSYIYSSTTLYNDEVINKRSLLFQNFTKHSINAEDLWKLHVKSGTNYHDYFNVKYNDHIQTVSTSQVVLGPKPIFKYHQHISDSNPHSILIN